MAQVLDTIGARLTPSVPLQITYGSQALAVGRKFATLFAHMAAVPGSGIPGQVYSVINVGDPVAVKTEIDAIAGVGSQASAMAVAFVNSNVLSGNANYPAFRICFLAFSDTSFGGAGDPALVAVKNLRSDILVSCYPASDAANLLKLKNLAITISGPDRDLKGQFGSFVQVASIDALTTQLAYDINSQYVMCESLPDTNTALVTQNGALTIGTNVISGLASTAGIYPGAAISGTGVPAGALVGQVTSSTVTMVDVNGQALLAAATEPSEAIGFQNMVSQAPELIAAAAAAGKLASTFPYTPRANVVLGGILPPQKHSDIIDWDPAGASEAALQAGLSPLTVAPGGNVVFIRTRTTYTTTPANITVNSYFDWQQIVTLYDFREVVYQISQNPPFNNNPGGTMASADVAAAFKDEVLREALLFQAQGAFQNVKENASQFVVQVNSTGRFDFYIPVNVIPGLMVIAGNIQGVVSASVFTL